RVAPCVVEQPREDERRVRVARGNGERAAQALDPRLGVAGHQGLAGRGESPAIRRPTLSSGRPALSSGPSAAAPVSSGRSVIVSWVPARSQEPKTSRRAPTPSATRLPAAGL